MPKSQNAINSGMHLKSYFEIHTCLPQNDFWSTTLILAIPGRMSVMYETQVQGLQCHHVLRSLLKRTVALKRARFNAQRKYHLLWPIALWLGNGSEWFRYQFCGAGHVQKLWGLHNAHSRIAERLLYGRGNCHGFCAHCLLPVG